MKQYRLSKEQQWQVDRATAETERRVETLNELAAMTKRVDAAYQDGWKDGYESAKSELGRDGEVG